MSKELTGNLCLSFTSLHTAQKILPDQILSLFIITVLFKHNNSADVLTKEHNKEHIIMFTSLSNY